MAIITEDPSMDENDGSIVSEDPSIGNTPLEEEIQNTKDEENEDEIEDEVTVSIGTEALPEPEETRDAPKWVKDLRKSHRELQKQNRELQQKLQATQPGDTTPELGKKPTLEDCDFDTDAYDSELLKWHEKKREIDKETEKKKSAEEAQAQDWRSKLDSYAEEKGKLRVRDYEDAEIAVQQTLNQTQQGIILHGADAPALVVYAIGKNKKTAEELAKITDPVKFAFAVAKLEKELKVSPKRPVTPPETRIGGTGRIAGGADAALERLRDDAEKTGDYSKVLAYKKTQRTK